VFFYVNSVPEVVPEELKVGQIIGLIDKSFSHSYQQRQIDFILSITQSLSKKRLHQRHHPSDGHHGFLGKKWAKLSD
jgi:hypothetical protein